MVRITSLAAIVASLPLVFSSPAEKIFSRQDRGGCGTETTAEDLAAIAEVAAASSYGSSDAFSGFSATSSSRLSAAAPTYPFGNLNIKTWIHVIAGNESLSEGNIPDSQLYAQMDELNANFAPNQVQFTLQGITRSFNSSWAVDATGAEAIYKKQLRRGGYEVLNLYFLKTLRRNALGYAYYPRSVPVGSPEFYLDGATNKFDTVPGGTLFPYNLGRTVTHEVGHWMGLAHTFEGYSCTGPGDLIADTAAHNQPTSGCPIGRDSCIDNEGPDPIHNYMDYSVDSCYEEFTPLQTKRMFDMWNYYRVPRACNADNCLRALRATTIPGRLAESQAFCADYTKFIVTDLSLIKPYAVSACSGEVVSRVSSACSCLPAAPTTTTP